MWVLWPVALPQQSRQAGQVLSSSSTTPLSADRSGDDRTAVPLPQPFLRMSMKEVLTREAQRAGGNCADTTSSDVSRVAVCFYGLWRTTKHVLPLIERNVLEPSRSVGLVDVFVHATTEMNLTNARSGEDGVALDPRAALQIRSCETVLEDTSEVDKQQRIDYVAASAHGVSLDFSYPYETVKNIVRARYSMSSVMQLVTRREQSADLTYTHLALVRPDVVVLAPLDWRGIGKGEIRVPNSQDFWGLNDRLAYGSSSSMMAVYGGMWQALVSGGLHMDAEQTAEQLLCYQVARHNVPVSLQPACLARVRANSEIEDLDLLATPKRPTDLKCAGRKGDGLPPNMSLDLVKRPTDWSHGCPALRDFVQQHSQWTFETPFVPLQPSRMKLSDVKDRTERHLGFTQWQSFQGEDRTTLPGERAPCIVVLAFDRPDLLDALLRRLNVMDYGADFGSVALTISIDAAPKGDGPASSRDVYARVEESVAIARNFTFFAGVSRLRIRTSHAGMVGQWLDAWRPEMDETDEHMACAILEDDLIPSAQAWRWTKGALDEYSVHLDRVGSLSWQRPTLVPANNVVGREVGVMPPSTGGQPFLYRLLGTWGFVALRDQWISFRRWFDQRVLAGPPPSVDFQGAKILPSLWFETKPADSMWSIWYIQYMADNDLFTLYANLDDETKTLCENARPTYGVNAHPGQAPDFQVLEGHDRALDRFPPFSALSLYDWDARKAQSRMQLVDQIEQRAQPTASTSFRRATRRGGALCTMSGAQNIPELELMLRSFVLFHEAEPKNVSGVTSEPIMIHVDADVATAAWLRNTPRIRKATHGRLVVTTGLQQFAGLSKEQMQQMGLWLWLQKHKIYVLRAALQRGYSYALWADADILFMAPLPQYELWHSTTWQDRHRDHHLGLSPHLINGNFSSRFGYYNAGYLVVRSGEPLEIWDSEIDAFHKENPESTTPDQVPMETVSSKVPFFTVTPGENVGWWRLIASHNREHSDMLDRFACETLDDQPYGRITFNGHLLRSLHFHTSRPQTGPEGARHFDLERTLKVLRYLLQDCRHEYSLTLIDEILQRMSDNRRRELRFGKVPNLVRKAPLLDVLP